MRRAFTLLELLVVILIIGLLMALLLPFLSQTKYTANITKCKVVLRNIATVQLSYAIDSKGFFPAGRPRYEGGGGWTTARDAGAQIRSWELFNNSRFPYDLRPIYYDYMQNNDTDLVLQCPLANREFVENDRDERIISYMLYTSNNYRMKHFYMADVGAYERMDTTWGVPAEPNTRFTMLASDFAFGKFSPHGREETGALTAHPAPNGYVIEHLGNINDAGGYVVNNTQDAPTNFADEDGSVQTFKINATTIDDTDNWVVNRHSRGKDALLPRELAK